MSERVIVDCDPGITRVAADIDDALALALLLRSPEVELAGVTVTAGNVDVDAAAEGALAVLEAAGRPDIPVHRGAARPGNHDYHRWNETFRKRRSHPDAARIWADWQQPRAAGGTAAGGAAEFLAAQVAARPGEVTVVAIGPATNLAHAIELLPEFGSLARRIVVMGGGWLLPDHLQELNFGWDAAAADTLLGAGADLTVIPLDVTLRTCLTLAEARGIADAATDPLGRLVADALLRWTEFSVSARGRAGCVLHDPLAAALVLDPTLVTTTARVAATDLHSRLSPGRLVTWDPDTVYAPAASLPARRPAALATDVDNDRLVRLLIDRLPGK
ncbi:nucleoside hydrolase [Actinomadura vinacea]|uniref:Nucleoside hydrolase n=1 Tax=Actinomadura vinacea TaxID=115336 RepID=A0ABN3IPH5_9ACTN